MSIELLKQYNNLFTANERKEITAKMLSELRKSRGLSQKSVAELIGIKQQTYGAYESGRNETPTEILVRLSMLYDMPVDVIIQRDKMSKNDKSPAEQLEYYEEQINELKKDILSGDPKAKETISQFIDGIEKLADIIKKSNQ